MFIREKSTTTTKAAWGNTNCDIFSWVSSQFAVWAWNMAATAAFSSSFVMDDFIGDVVAVDWGGISWHLVRENRLTDDVLVASSLPSKRLDIAPLFQVGGRDDGPDLGPESWPVGPLEAPLTYMEALPLPARAAGRRLTTTEEERGMIWESSLNSGLSSEGIVEKDLVKTDLALTSYHIPRGQSRLPCPCCWPG